MMVLPQPSESTVVLPRMPQAQRDESTPTPGQSTTYKSSSNDRNGKGGSRLSVALDSGEDVG
jgi:hypothetical protein